MLDGASFAERSHLHGEDFGTHFEGNRHVLGRILEKKRLIVAGEPHEHIRPLLMLLSGQVKGAYAAGAAIALEKMGLSDSFDFVLGTSTGAPVSAYFLSGQVSAVASIYHEECVTRPFFDMRQFLKDRYDENRYAADVDMLTRIFRNGQKKLDQDTVRASRTKLFVTGTNADTGELELIDAKQGDMVEALRLSIAIPGAYPPVEYNGRRYIDGATAEPLPIDAALKLFPEATDVLILENLPEGESSYPKKLFGRTLIGRPSVSHTTLQALNNHDRRYAESLQRIRNDGERRYLMMRPTADLMSHPKTTKDFQNISKKAERALLAQFELAQRA